MNRRFAAAFAACSILAALAASASIAYRVSLADADGEKAAREDFGRLTSTLSTVKGAGDLADPLLRERLTSHYRSDPALLLLVVYERGSGLRWRIPAETPYLPAIENGRSSPEPNYPPGSTLLISAPLAGDSSGKLAIDALYVTLSQVSVFAAFRDALFGLGAFISLAAISLALAAALSQRQSSATLRETAAAAAEFQFDTLSRSDDEEDVEASNSASIPADSFQRSSASPYSSPFASEEDEYDIPDLDEALAVEMTLSPPEELEATIAQMEPEEGGGRLEKAKPEERGAPLAAATPESTDPASTQKKPTGLYSPASGLGWENYLEERLEAELARSASFEQDLSLILLSHDGLGPDSPAYKATASAISDFFGFRDLAFERGRDGFAVIAPNIAADQALRSAEDFLKRLTFLLREYQSDPMASVPVFMGISSRSGRLVDAKRLEQEAQAAMNKAREDKDTRIVAFHPDPDRYRVFLASKGG